MSIMFLPLLLLSLLTTFAHVHCVEETIPPQECHNFNGACFFFPYVKYNPIVNQSTAREICLENGGDLPSIHSAEENQFLLDHIQVPIRYWLGMVLQFTDTSMGSPVVAAVAWTDGTPVDFANPKAPGFQFGSPPWANYSDFPDEPNNFLQTTMPYCTDIKSLTPTDPPSVKAWESQDCSGLVRVVCKKPAV